MKREVKQKAGLTNPNERMGNCLRRGFSWPKDTQEEYKKPKTGKLKQKKSRQVIKRRKKEFHKESEEISPSYHQGSHEDHAKEPLYAFIVHVPERTPSINSTEADYENVGPKDKRTKQLAPGPETEYAVLRVPSNPRPSGSIQDEEYELIMHCPSPLPIPLQPDEFGESEYIENSKKWKRR
ncbi:LOW QUALITY PROTEIN: germinal center-associated signaling and motility protein [Trichosurus vulpecula]|uniref:LOW QUALITY PROTEIN: germinal center-associated signaling and motility protein n=1 Tax=Trichosurus vulpecula TaxID=9337 RepID=UPI00186B0BE5|nr:LOW QUALITY PROTEIN: germinal center-associated signaling and motility protein [Trichosurus vulpecula]